MLRELSAVLIDLQTGVVDFAQAATVRGVPIALTRVDFTLPLDMQPVFRDGSCILLADLPRTRDEGGFGLMRSSLGLALAAEPVDAFPEDEP